MTTYNDDQDLILGQISKLEQPNAIYLGKIAEEDYMSKDLWLDTESAHVVYVMGSRRSGKSYTLGTIAEGLSLNSLSTPGCSTSEVPNQRSATFSKSILYNSLIVSVI